MKVLSIDPGYGRCGVAVVEGNANSQTRIFSDCIETDNDESFFNRLADINEEVQTLIDKHQPDALAIEKLFFNRNTTTAMKVAQVKGGLALTAKRAGLAVFEYTPQEIKTAVVGYGKAQKEQVMQMTTQLVEMPESAVHDDEYDAVAVGITCLAHEG